MQVINKPWERITKLWSVPKSDGQYRLIRYVLREKVPDGELLHHTLTGELVFLNQEELAELDKLPGEVGEALKPFVDKHFIVPVNYNENKVLEQLRFVLRLADRRKEITGYTILPTTYCNARCFYCFENNVEHKHMTIETANDTVRFIKEHHGDQSVRLTWFGGEPLVGWKIINHICQQLTENQIHFRSNMISNGYLFDSEMVERAKKIWNLQEVQITLDGTREIYNRVKSYVSVSDDPYLHVLDNIDRLLNAGIRVSIRLNMDKHNHEDLCRLIDELAERFSNREGFAVYCAVLFDNAGFAPILHREEDNELLCTWKHEIEQTIHDKGLAGISYKLPRLINNYCMADGDSSAIINPDGTMCKCEHHVDENLGNLKDGWTNLPAVQAYKTPRKLSKCLDCVLQPFCYHLESCETDKDCTDDFYESLMKDSKEAMRMIYESKISLSDNPDEEAVTEMRPLNC